jgi:hypothetical protein
VSLLRDIQSSVVSDTPNLECVLLKLRLLAARLESDLLGDWVKYELSGYPDDVEVPSYRKVVVSFRGTFSGAFGAGINNAPIPSWLVEQHAGEKWTKKTIREGISSVDDLVKYAEKSGSIGLDCSNLILLLQGKIYEDYACNDISGSFSRTSLVQIQTEVKSRILEFTIQLEKAMPSAADISLEPSQIDNINNRDITNIVNQTVYNITARDHATIGINIIQGDSKALTQKLEQDGIPRIEAKELAEIVENEQPISQEEPLGKKAQQWLMDNLKKAQDGTWKVGVSVATDVIKEAVKNYYGL